MRAVGVSFVAGASALSLEVTAGRLLAPYVGVSLYTWTSIIGVVLAGAALGNYAGGRAADRLPTLQALGGVLLLAGVVSASALVAAAGILEWGWLPRLPLVEMILALTVCIFFLPSLVLGAVTPLAARLAVRDDATSGRVVGAVYAASTAGALVGAFATGLFLVQTIGSRGVVLAVAVVLVATAALTSEWRCRARTVRTLLAVALACAAVYLLGGQSLLRGPCLRESSYYCIQVRDAQLDRGPAASLVLDRLVHSRVSPINPTLLGYSYLRIYAGVTESLVSGSGAPRVLFVGGGAYGFPRYLEATYPAANITVVEIDPQVTEISHELLGLRRDTRIVSVHRDARAFLIDWTGEAPYDLVYGDAYSDLSAPYHLTTVEYDRLVFRALTDDGVYMANIIDDYEHGEFLRAFIATVREVFGNVYLVRQGTFTGGQAETAVVVASKRPIDLHSGARVADGMVVVAESELEEYLAAGRRIVLTDDYAPVDQLTAGLFMQRERLVDAPR